MGLFRKSSAGDASSSPSAAGALPERPFNTDEAALDRLDSQLAAVVAGLNGGSNDQVRNAIRSMSDSAGARTAQELLVFMAAHGKESVDVDHEYGRTFRWLAACCEQAAPNPARHLMIARCLWFAFVFRLEWQPQFAERADTELLVNHVPKDAYETIKRTAAWAIKDMPADQIIVEDRGTQLRVGGLKAGWGSLESAQGTFPVSTLIQSGSPS